MGETSRDRTEEQESPIPEQTGSRRFEAGDKYTEALHEELKRRENEKDAGGFRDVGYDPTLPGQEEITAGTPEHERVLKSYPTATCYGPDVNVVVPPEKDEQPGSSQVGDPSVHNEPLEHEQDQDQDQGDEPDPCVEDQE